MEALHAAEIKDKYLSQGAIAVGNSSEEFTVCQPTADRPGCEAYFSLMPAVATHRCRTLPE